MKTQTGQELSFKSIPVKSFAKLRFWNNELLIVKKESVIYIALPCRSAVSVTKIADVNIVRKLRYLQQP